MEGIWVKSVGSALSDNKYWFYVMWLEKYLYLRKYCVTIGPSCSEGGRVDFVGQDLFFGNSVFYFLVFCFISLAFLMF